MENLQIAFTGYLNYSHLQFYSNIGNYPVSVRTNVAPISWNWELLGLSALSPQISTEDGLTWWLQLFVHQNADGAGHLELQLLAAIVRYLDNLGVVLVQHLDTIHRDYNVAHFEARALRRCLRLNGSHHDGLGAVNAKAKLPRIALDHHGFVHS